MTRPFHSITINGKNTWDEWRLMPVKAGRIDFATAELRYESAEVAGADDALDFTEALTGYPLYNSRRGTITFRFFNNGVPVRDRFDSLKNFLHGKKATAIIEDQPEYFYEGRFMVGDLKWANRGNWGDVDISYILNAYKIEVTSSSEDWLWNPFNFENGVIREYGSFIINGTQAIHVVGSRKPTAPRFIVDGDIVLHFDGVDYALQTGTNVIPAVVLLEDEYDITFRGNGSVAIDMRAGSL